MIYRYIDKQNSNFRGGIRTEKFPLKEHYIVRELSDKKPSPLKFFKLLNLLVVEGYSIKEGIDLILESKDKYIDRKNIKNVKRDMERGMPFSESISRYFKLSNFELTLIKLAQKEGNLKDVLGDVINHLEENKNAKNRTKRALYYPILLLFLGLLLLIFISKFVAPVFLNVLQGFGGELPFISRISFGFSKMLESSGISIFLVLIAFILLLFLIIIKFPRLEMFLRKRIYKSGFLGSIYRSKFQFTFFKEFGMLYKYSGNFEDVMNFIMDESTDIYVKETLNKILNRISYGLKIEEIDEFFDLFSNFSMSIFSKLNREEVVTKSTFELAKLYKNRYDELVDTFIKMIGPVMVLVIGGVVAVISLGIMLPIFNLGNNL